MKVLVVGATGFIGGSVARAAVEAGHEVRAIRRASSKTAAIDDLDIAYVEGDLDDGESLERALGGVEACLHAAGYFPRHSFRANSTLRQAVVQMRNLLDACLATGVERVVYTSSMSTIGPARDGYASEDDWYVPGTVDTPYHQAKYAMEMEALAYGLRGLHVVVVNPTGVFGPGDVGPTTGVIPLSLAKRKLPAVIEGRMNLIDVRDMAQAQIAALARGRSGERYILGAHNLTVREAIERMADLAGVPAPRFELPAALARPLGKASEVYGMLRKEFPLMPVEFVEMIRHGQWFDTSKAERELGLVGRPIEETLADELDWFRDHGYLSTTRPEQPPGSLR